MVALCRSYIPDFYYFNNHFCKMGEFIAACMGYFIRILSIFHEDADSEKNKLNQKRFNILILLLSNKKIMIPSWYNQP